MKFSTGIINIFLIVGGGLIGIVIAFNTPPHWEKLDIPSQHKDVSEILFVDHNDPDKVQNDVIYVRTKSGDVYSISYNQWNLLPSLPNEETISSIGSDIGFDIESADSSIIATTNKNHFYQLNNTEWTSISEFEESHWNTEFDQCATTTEWRFPPPVEVGVIDSKGVVFEHTISGFFKCYVLYEDGHLEGWSRESSSLAIIGLSQIYCAIGAIAGILLSLIFWLYRKFRSNKESFMTSNHYDVIIIGAGQPART